MNKQVKITIRLNEDLYEMVKAKCNEQFGIGVSPLVKVFLRSFVTQRGVGFYIGDDDLSKLFQKWITKKRLNKGVRGGTHLPGPYLRDLYDL